MAGLQFLQLPQLLVQAELVIAILQSELAAIIDGRQPKKKLGQALHVGVLRIVVGAGALNLGDL